MSTEHMDKNNDLTSKVKKAREYSYLGIYEKAEPSFDEAIKLIKQRIKNTDTRDHTLKNAYQRLLKEVQLEKKQTSTLMHLIRHARLPEEKQPERKIGSFRNRLPFNKVPFACHLEKKYEMDNRVESNNHPSHQLYMPKNNPPPNQYSSNNRPQMNNNRMQIEPNYYQQPPPQQHMNYDMGYQSNQPNYNPLPNYSNMSGNYSQGYNNQANIPPYKDPMVWDPAPSKPARKKKKAPRNSSVNRKMKKSNTRNYDKPWLNGIKTEKEAREEEEKKSKFLYHHYPDGNGPDADLIKTIESSIMLSNPNVSFDDIAGLKNAKEALKMGVIAPLMMKDFFTKIRKPPKGILLYGPAGTGKTMLAKAIATTGKTSFFIVNPSTLASKWKGESEKLVRLLFEMARFYAPTTIFIDEIDSLLSERSDKEHEASRRVKVQFFIEIDGIASNNAEDTPRVFLLGATNRPWDLDEAILRRLSKRIYIPLPNPSARRKLFELKLKSINLAKDIDYDYLVEKTNLYNSDDIEEVCREACLAPFRRNLDNINDNASTQFFKDMEQEMMAAEITMDDFKEVIERVKPSASTKYLDRFDEWTKNHAST